MQGHGFDAHLATNLYAATVCAMLSVRVPATVRDRPKNNNQWNALSQKLECERDEYEKYDICSQPAQAPDLLSDLHHDHFIIMGPDSWPRFSTQILDPDSRPNMADVPLRPRFSWDIKSIPQIDGRDDQE